MRDLVLFYFYGGGARLNTDQLATQTDKDWSTGRPTCQNHQVSIVRDDDHQDNDEHDPDKHRATSMANTMDVTVKLSSKQRIYGQQPNLSKWPERILSQEPR